MNTDKFLQLDNIEKIGSTKDRLQKYLERIFNSLMYGNSSLTNLNMDTNIEEWIIQRAQSANPYQAKEDNRKIELDTLLFLLNQIDNRIDADFLEISGSNRVFIKIENQKRELSDLSSGFTSILKIIQSIILFCIILVPSVTSPFTTLPAPITQFFPIFAPHSITTFAPTHVLSPIDTGVLINSDSLSSLRR